MRYAWDQFDAYFSVARSGRMRYAAILATIAWLRRWDRATAPRVDAFAANSAWVAGRIARYYGRPATVVPPPVDTDFFVPGEVAEAEPYYLVVSALSPYKRLDLAIEAFNRMQRKLIVVGTGPDAARLAAIAGPTVEMRGWVERRDLRTLYQGARGLVLTAVEDAGIVPLESMACGRPAIVLDRGGAREAVIEGVNGTYIRAQKPESVVEAIDRAEAVSFNSEKIRESALPYATEHFLSRLSSFVGGALHRSNAVAATSTTFASHQPTTESAR
jgi:glycosyltransferase involved in cell wall biosynthesis